LWHGDLTVVAIGDDHDETDNQEDKNGIKNELSAEIQRIP
jgi:hypothetical protein